MSYPHVNSAVSEINRNVFGKVIDPLYEQLKKEEANYDELVKSDKSDTIHKNYDEACQSEMMNMDKEIWDLDHDLQLSNKFYNKKRETIETEFGAKMSALTSQYKHVREQLSREQLSREQIDILDKTKNNISVLKKEIEYMEDKRKKAIKAINAYIDRLRLDRSRLMSYPLKFHYDTSAEVFNKIITNFENVLKDFKDWQLKNKLAIKAINADIKQVCEANYEKFGFKSVCCPDQALANVKYIEDLSPPLTPSIQIPKWCEGGNDMYLRCLVEFHAMIENNLHTQHCRTQYSETEIASWNACKWIDQLIETLPKDAEEILEVLVESRMNLLGPGGRSDGMCFIEALGKIITKKFPPHTYSDSHSIPPSATNFIKIWIEANDYKVKSDGTFAAMDAKHMQDSMDLKAKHKQARHPFLMKYYQTKPDIVSVLTRLIRVLPADAKDLKIQLNYLLSFLQENSGVSLLNYFWGCLQNIITRQFPPHTYGSYHGIPDWASTFIQIWIEANGTM